jgi:hypothetical protein
LALPIGLDEKWSKLDELRNILYSQFYDPKMLDFDKMREQAIK